ncbi:MAG: thioredoxin [Oligoflexia bacterium]|nr:thioredoxin [Oligoflexia bacterium]
MSGNIKQFTDSNFETEVIKSTQPVLVDFWASWCGPCMMQLPILEEFSGFAEGKIVVGKLSTEENNAMPVKYGVQAIPTLMLFKDGAVVEKMVGVQSLEKLKKLMDKY